MRPNYLTRPNFKLKLEAKPTNDLLLITGLKGSRVIGI